MFDFMRLPPIGPKKFSVSHSLDLGFAFLVWSLYLTNTRTSLLYKSTVYVLFVVVVFFALLSGE